MSRNAVFLLTLRDSGVRFLAVDMPEANDLTVGIMALVAQQERAAISRRTKEALAAAKARGVELGNANGVAALLRAGADATQLASEIPFMGALLKNEQDTRAIGSFLERGGKPPANFEALGTKRRH